MLPSTVLITTAEAARRLGVSREQVRQMLEYGMLACFRIEGRARARYVDLEGEWTENERVLFSVQDAAQRFGMRYDDNLKLLLDSNLARCTHCCHSRRVGRKDTSASCTPSRNDARQRMKVGSSS